MGATQVARDHNVQELRKVSDDGGWSVVTRRVMLGSAPRMLSCKRQLPRRVWRMVLWGRGLVSEARLLSLWRGFRCAVRFRVGVRVGLRVGLRIGLRIALRIGLGVGLQIGLSIARGRRGRARGAGARPLLVGSLVGDNVSGNEGAGGDDDSGRGDHRRLPLCAFVFGRDVVQPTLDVGAVADAVAAAARAALGAEANALLDRRLAPRADHADVRALHRHGFSEENHRGRHYAAVLRLLREGRRRELREDESGAGRVAHVLAGAHAVR
mmetsp:Transcript_1684/g.4220  ORF Transcript_1684/g.4220 Transcript_1684/m.4220 type:complete len:268 (+) Transcript_1684:59-862(+)